MCDGKECGCKFDPDIFARRYVKILEENEQLSDRRKSAVEKLEKLRVLSSEYRSVLFDVKHEIENADDGNVDIEAIKRFVDDALRIPLVF